ncbi:hypothetical protein RND71_040510 [Anisodus tanguticus]|uniref:Maturase K n=1 Tax=Anisodus tanguticus TaxID=243964 RepID=A0AAE1QU85_9SOLA|nr:hypothetical protein RND71_040510 [Anisodus tanguticus]
MDVDPSGGDNHSGPGRSGDHSQERKRPSRGKPYESPKGRQSALFLSIEGAKNGLCSPLQYEERNKGRSLDRSRSSTYRKDHERGDRMVLESIYDLEFPDTSHFRSGQGFHSVLRRIKEEWGTSRWFLEFDIGSVFTPSTDIDSSQSLRKRSTIPSSFTPFESLFRQTTRRR